MKKKEWSEGLDQLDPVLVEKYLEERDTYEEKNNARRRGWRILGALAACLALILGTVLLIPLWQGGTGNDRSAIPILSVQMPSRAPQYFGEEDSIASSEGTAVVDDPAGISVVARLLEVLPDTYTFFGDWRQYEYRLLRMETVKLIRGVEMTEEFYYLIPLAYMTDFSAFDSFLIQNMHQFEYEYSVLYNQAKDKAERFSLPLFRYDPYPLPRMGKNFMAFDANEAFSEELWNANEAWKRDTKYASGWNTLKEAEEAHRREAEQGPAYLNTYSVHLLREISGEAADVLEEIASWKNGLFIPNFTLWSEKSTHRLGFSFHATRYINGFATNERVHVYSKEFTGHGEDSYSYSRARFGEEDTTHLPDLPSAFAAVKEALSEGAIAPPHYESKEPTRTVQVGAFGWYAKTDRGILGIIRVTWCFETEQWERYYDDAYYTVSYGEEECRPIDRDALLELFGECEATYVYTGGYDAHGKTEAWEMW